MQNAEALIAEAKVKRNAGDTAAALALYEQAAESLRGEDVARFAHTARHVADLARVLGQMNVAQRWVAEVLAIYRRDGTEKLELANALRVDALVKEAVGNVAGAREMWLEARGLYAAVAGEATDASFKSGVEAGVAECDRRLGEH